MQVMDDRVNKLSAKVNQMQSVNSADVQNTSVLTQTPPHARCKALSCRHDRHTMPLRRLNPRLFETQSVGLTATPTQTFWITLSKFPIQTQVMNKTAKLQPPAQNYSQSHRRLRVSWADASRQHCLTRSEDNGRLNKAPRTAVTASPNIDKVLMSRLSAQTKPRTSNWQGPKLCS